MSYSNPTTCCYQFPVETISAAAILQRIIGPSGLQGRLVDIGFVTTTGTTDASSTIDVGLTGDVDAFGTLTVPIQAAAAVTNGMTRGTDEDIPADTVLEVSANGECTAGAGDIIVVIDWY